MNDDDSDDLPVGEVGAWAEEKHLRLRKYIDASRAARRKFVEGSGGASYIDLFSGPGRSKIRETHQIIDGSPVVAFKAAQDSRVPFSEFYVADESHDLAIAAQARIAKLGGTARLEIGQATQTAKLIIDQLNPYGLHFAFLDPYSLTDLPFSVFIQFARLKRIDLLVHVSALDLQRNLHLYTAEGDDRLESFAPGWRKVVDLNQSQPAIRAAILAHWTSQMERLGLPTAKHAELITGSVNQRLYWLVFASRSDFAKRLWDEIRTIDGQKGLF